MVNVELSIIWLWSSRVAFVTPRLDSPSWWLGVGGGHLGVGVGKEPSINVDGLEVFALTATIEVTEAARRPDVSDVTCGTIDICRKAT